MIDGPKRVKLATGRRKENGFVVRVRDRKLRRPSADNKPKVHIRWHAIGQFRYYDARSGHAVFIAPPGREAPEPLIDPIREERAPSRRAYVKGIPGLPSGHPESLLVDQYVQWIGGDDRFDRRYLRGERQWCDLFDGSRWRLFEAKANIDRRSIRTAVGQLFDYRRAFPRRPSLGILLAAHPGASAIAYIRSCGCVAVWRTTSGRFSDSTENKSWTARS